MDSQPPTFNIFVVRHGERVDAVFGEWVAHCFDSHGAYRRLDLNLPAKLPPRPCQHYQVDTPITELGHWQARQAGTALASLPGVNIGSVLTSPAFRCVQTAAEILSCLPRKVLMQVEPGLLEAGCWNAGVLTPERVVLFDPPVLAGLGYPVDAAVSVPPLTSLPVASEDIIGMYRRGGDVMRRLVQRHKEGGVGDLLIVAHGSSLDVLTHGLRYPNPEVTPGEFAGASSFEDQQKAFMMRMAKGRVCADSFCGVAQLRYDRSSGSVEVMDSSALGLTHNANKRFVFGQS
mmetsp:Transcript_43673/g.78525  ORF Transcript_43673/g.78525 Transcript_43673/m.78525 type:complete len:289 (+) Transcript_43673:58-924(+)